MKMGVLPIRSRLTIKITTREMNPHRRSDAHVNALVMALNPSRQATESPHNINGIRPKSKTTVYLLKPTPFFFGFRCFS